MPLFDDYSIEEMFQNVFLIKGKTRYDTAMLFMRYQEYYESPKFHKQKFSIWEFMKWYTAENSSSGLLFAYCADWSGFNVPSWAIEEAQAYAFRSSDDTVYDDIMEALIDAYVDRSQDYYIIGVTEGDDETLKHEVAHALYYTNENYRIEMKVHLARLNKKRYNKLYNAILRHGYHESTVEDEMHAYLATGPAPFLKELYGPRIAAPFIKTFKEYYASI